MQKALALQAEAREKIAQSEALLAQYGLADVAHSRRQRRRRQGGSNQGVRAMSAYQSNGKVKPPTNVASSTTSIKIAEKAPPAPCSRMQGPCTKRGHADYVGCSCLRQRAFRREPECEAQPWGDATASRSWSGRSAWPRIYRNEDNQAAAKIIRV